MAVQVAAEADRTVLESVPVDTMVLVLVEVPEDMMPGQEELQRQNMEAKQ